MLVMSVNPGFGGQAFEPVALDKLRALRDRPGPRTACEKSTEESTRNDRRGAEAGAQLYSVGSAIFHSHDYRATISNLTMLARTHQTTG